MQEILNYVKPELVVVAVVLYFIGMGIKKTEAIKDKWIPLILGVLGIGICAIWVGSTSVIETTQDWFTAIFVTIVQGVLVAGLSTYVNQIIKQTSKKED